MKVLITGSNGQLGRELLEYYKAVKNVIVVGFDKDDLDITSLHSVDKVIKNIYPDVIINTAAYTNVDGSESNYKQAYEVNVIGARNIAIAADSINAKVVHISTDFVFAGDKTMPYFEYDETNPLSVYGKTKLAGEWMVRNNCKRHFILRTSWLYGKYGNNFVKTMIKMGDTNDKVSVVTDQIGAPTSVSDLVDAIANIVGTQSYGTYHYSNKGKCSWNEFAREIFKIMNKDVHVNDILSDQLDRPAKRPSYSVMDTNMIINEFDLEIKCWKESLYDFICENYSLNKI